MQKDNDIILSMSQTIEDLSLSISKISIKNKSLEQHIHNKVRNCPNQHPLRYMTADQKSKMVFIQCDVCHQKPQNISNVFWHCRRCDYDECRKCGGYWRQECAYSHPLKLINYSINTICCDICFKNHLTSGWHCQCDFDMCESCHDKILDD